MLTLSIDPGLTGAYAIFADNGVVLTLADLPVIRDQKTAWIDATTFAAALNSRIRQAGYEDQECTAIIERVHPMPRNGSQAAFSQGMTLGSILSALQLVRARIEFVAPQTWKGSLGMRGNKEWSDRERKEASLNKARLLFPSAALARAKDHGRAEALLIGYWYREIRSKAAA